jgi:streptogramin lyase
VCVCGERHLLRVACITCRLPAAFSASRTWRPARPRCAEDEGRRRATRLVGFQGRLWVSEWNVGNLSVYDPASKSWTVHKLPGDAPHAYAVYVDDKGKVWVSDFGANAILSFDPKSEAFDSLPSDKPDAAVRQLNGRPGEGVPSRA